VYLERSGRVFGTGFGSYGHHRCVTHLYGIPLRNFYLSVDLSVRFAKTQMKAKESNEEEDLILHNK
jgi:hypothetical protein